MEDNTQDEYDDAFELGRAVKMIEMFLRLMDHSTLTFIKITYFRLQGLASRLGIELPNQPLELDTTTNDERKQFFENQIDHVEARIRRQSQYNIDMFCNGKSVESYLTYMVFAKRGKEIAPGADFREHLKYHVEELQAIVNLKGIDISEELNMAKAWLEGEPGNDIEVEQRIRSQLQKKLGKKKIEKRRSEIDPTRIITNDHWAISLVRLPDSSNNEHAFLVLEGQSGNTLMIWFADFVANDALDLLRPGVRDGKVRIDYHQLKKEPGSTAKLLFRCRKKLMEIRKGDRLLHSTWQIPKPTGEVLVRNLKTLQDNPPKYNILGNTMLAVTSATSSSNSTGHNCFTFSRMVLHDLHDDYIEIQENTLDTWIYSATSRYLVDKQPNNQRSDMLGFHGIFMFVAGVLTAAFLFKLFNF